MFQSHTVKGLLYFRDMPDFGVMPLHTVTKFSSSRFLLVFGVPLGVIFAPRTLDEERWPATNPEEGMRLPIGQEGVLEVGEEGLNDGGLVHTVAGHQPELVAEAEPEAVLPAVGKSHFDGPPQVDDASETIRAEPVGR